MGTHPRCACTTLDGHALPQMSTHNPSWVLITPYMCAKPCRTTISAHGHVQPHICMHNSRQARTTLDGHAQPQAGMHSLRCGMHNPRQANPPGQTPQTLQGHTPPQSPPCTSEQSGRPCPGAVVQREQWLLLEVTYEQGPF